MGNQQSCINDYKSTTMTMATYTCFTTAICYFFDNNLNNENMLKSGIGFIAALLLYVVNMVQAKIQYDEAKRSPKE